MIELRVWCKSHVITQGLANYDWSDGNQSEITKFTVWYVILFEGLEGVLLKKDKGWVSIFSFG